MEETKEKVSVKWWNHQSALSASARNIHNKEIYADVLIRCDGQEFWGHKFIIAACSEYFEEILKDIPYRGSVMIPEEIRTKEFTYLLEYMYLGEAIVAEEEIPEIIKAAEILRIRGLAIPYEDDSKNDNKQVINEQDKLKNNDQESGIKRRKRNNCLSIETDKQQLSPRKVLQRSPNNGEEYPQHLKYLQTHIPETANINKQDDESDHKILGSQVCEDVKSDFTEPSMGVNNMLKVLIGNAAETPKNSRSSSNRTKMSVSKQNNNLDSDGSSETTSSSSSSLLCPHCGKMFQWKSNLTKHIRTHTGEKPYGCEYCSYRTSYSEALKRHLRTHTDAKPYQCELCNFKCKHSGSLRAHELKHSQENKFTQDLHESFSKEEPTIIKTEPDIILDSE